MDVGIINPFLEATLDITRTMAMLEIEVGSPKLKQGKHSSGMVTGLIALTSSSHNGSLSITFDEEVLFKIYRNMLGEEHDDNIDEQILDLAGE
ncbi:MAG: chemotaxis protein CheX, partial [Reinekea sp.]